MILISAALVLAAIVLLIAGVVLAKPFLVMWSIVISVLSAVCLLIGALLRRHELFPAGRGTAVGSATTPQGPSVPSPFTAAVAHAGNLPVGAMIGGTPGQLPHHGAVAMPPPAPAPMPAAAPIPRPPVPAAHGLGSDSIVLVIPGRRRFHLPNCRQLVGRDVEELTVEEAREEGFTSCTTCQAEGQKSPEAPDSTEILASIETLASTETVERSESPESPESPESANGPESLESSSRTADPAGLEKPVGPEKPEGAERGDADPDTPESTVPSGLDSHRPGSDEPDPADTAEFPAITTKLSGPQSPVSSDTGASSDEGVSSATVSPTTPVASKAEPIDWFKRPSPAPAGAAATERVEPAETAEAGRAGLRVPAGSTSTTSGTTSGTTPAVSSSSGATVRVMAGTRRYHRAECPLLRAADDAGVETMSEQEAEAAGLTSCSVCSATPS
ncbi:hypothetical protein [Sphaerimonospora thailandensis]|uniref:Uncharacterized protein n=1 Tax=Sphaerimonospora thailandensis TaxID=795644 RepID=A0A8J3R596_9ACTN|nr:hypothetical protein [Sphaerimonospora thailandensis]GIH68234.1 hypothetical protein Mth01_04870 [Sphaerimonospora thailandensis]